MLIPALDRAHAAAVRHAHDAIANYGGAMLVGDMGTGKALANGTPIPTPTGWQPIAALRPGDTVFDERGQPVQVQAVFPQVLVADHFPMC